MIKSPSNWGGVEKTSCGASSTVSADRASRAEVRAMNTIKIYSGSEATYLHLLLLLASKEERRQ